MPDRASSSSSPSRKDSATAARNYPLKLKSWFTNLCSRASASPSHPHSLTPSRHPPHAQTHSQLLSTLPLEIQRQIYAHILHSYGSVQHILLSNNKLTHMRCASPTSHIYFQTQSARNGVCMPYDTAYRKSVQNGREIVPLLLSCRQT
ncbi:uncharacterized protein K444DRAFT_366556 [Hyaloscypha bicolor E]|uniref:DUF7730 domain-containing protein n=1 Tax=Hyaloscypha bicolor E TaxID=1095630 RepID=A0A2J6TE17_9HELO|nr:uncharacterized protein K444DRAFT_366556 [Hyaloscypha bicolor E]PMD61274.1 hypothetical protein K444DRAFT_366556 [Hyaloscypha bicolor E]